MVRVRFAPSPTGYLHVGNARTALFNYLFARKHRGSFVLRIEDTDAERSLREYEAALMDDLKWMGIEWDEGPDKGGDFGPYRQTDRLELYSRLAENLLREGKAYRCYCTKEELEERRAEQLSEKKTAGYDNRCRNITRREVSGYEAECRTPVVRLKVPEKTVTVTDLIRGEVVFEAMHIPDFVIMKSAGTPTFNFAVVVDDMLMKITHVIRGEDHLSNTPKHIMIFDALGAERPEFAHMSMTLGPDKARLSKRHGATSVRAYRKEGYLPEAFSNYIALLGWGTADSQDIFSREELISEFSIERCNKSSAVFDPDKLMWMNGYYMRKKTPEKILELAMPFLIQAGLAAEDSSAQHLGYLREAVALEQEKIKLLKDVPERIGFFVNPPVYDEKAVGKHLGEEGRKALTGVYEALERCEKWTEECLEQAVRNFCAEEGYKPGAIFHPLRVAVSGTTKGPGLFEMLQLLGRSKTVERIKLFLSRGAGV